MDKKIIKRILVVTLIFTSISAANNLPHLEGLRSIDIVRLLTFGIGIGATLVCLAMLIISKKKFEQ
ncbi:MAG: hypothetical protein ABI851_13310 [Saprospiraceae bacterium]